VKLGQGGIKRQKRDNQWPRPFISEVERTQGAVVDGCEDREKLKPTTTEEHEGERKKKVAKGVLYKQHQFNGRAPKKPQSKEKNHRQRAKS